MPRSKREKVVSLTKVSKKTREGKENLVAEVRSAVDKYASLYVFTIDNMRAPAFNAVRQHFKATSRIFFGKNNVMGVALGKSHSDEYAEGLHKVSNLLKGQCGLLFTNASHTEVVNYFKTLKEPEFARCGDVATQTITLSAGPLEQFPFSMEPQLRRLNMPTELKKGVVMLIQDFEVCQEGEPLSADAAKILRLLDTKLASFEVHLRGHWTRAKGLKLLA